VVPRPLANCRADGFNYFNAFAWFFNLAEDSLIALADVRGGSIASVWPSGDDFRPNPGNGHGQIAPGCLKRAIFDQRQQSELR